MSFIDFKFYAEGIWEYFLSSHQVSSENLTISWILGQLHKEPHSCKNVYHALHDFVRWTDDL